MWQQRERAPGGGKIEDIDKQTQPEEEKKDIGTAPRRSSEIRKEVLEGKKEWDASNADLRREEVVDELWVGSRTSKPPPEAKEHDGLKRKYEGKRESTTR